MAGRNKSLYELKEEIDSMRRSLKMKDDTILFLQKEKESLQREVKHYEMICDGVEAHEATRRKYEEELKALRNDIQHWKQVVKRHRQAQRSTTRDSNALDQQQRAIVDELVKNMYNLMSEIQSETSSSIQKQTSKILDHLDHDSCWSLLEVSSRAHSEAYRHLTKYKMLLESATNKPVMKYSHTSIDSGLVRGVSNSLHSVGYRSAVLKMAKQSITNTNKSAESDFRSRTQKSSATPEFRTVPGFLPGLKGLTKY